MVIFVCVKDLVNTLKKLGIYLFRRFASLLLLNVNSAINDYVAKINVIEIELAKEEKKEEEVAELKILA